MMGLELEFVFRIATKKIDQNVLASENDVSNLLTLRKINLSYLENFYYNKHFITAIENIRFEIYLRFI